MYDVFLSHNRKEKAWVRRFYEILTSAGLSVFFDEESVEPGANVPRTIEVALENSKYVILVLSRAALASEWVSMESAIMLYADPAASARQLLPVMIEEVSAKEIPLSLRFRHGVDLTNPDRRDRELARLLKHLGINSDIVAIKSFWEADQPSRSSPSGVLALADIDDVISWGWDGNKLLDELIKLDYQTIAQLTHEHEGEIAQWAPVFMDHPDTWRLLTVGPEKIVGYWHFVPLFSREFELAITGRLKDSQITSNLVRVLELPGVYDVYFVSICALPLYRRTARMRPLFTSFFDVAYDLALAGVRVGRICTNAYTPSGEALCKDLGFHLEQKHLDKGTIYSLSFLELLNHSLSNHRPELLELYGVKRQPVQLRVI